MSANHPATNHLDETVVAAYLAGRLQPDERRRVEAHLAGCAECRAEAAEVTGIVSGLAQSRRSTWIGVAAAAVVLLALAPVIRGRLVDRADRQRELPDASPAGPVARSPAGPVTGPLVLVWSSVEGATRYRPVVLDDEGRIVWETTGPDTVAAVPRSIAVEPGRPYFWKVGAEIGVDHWLSSRMVEFRLEQRR